MLRELKFFDCFRNKETDVVDDLDPVLLISGIGGSILNSKDKKTGFQIRIWVRILLANWEFQKKALSIYNPKTGTFLLFFFFFYLS